MAKFDLNDSGRGRHYRLGARAAARSAMSWRKRASRFVILEAGARIENPGFHQRRMGKASASSPGPICAPRPGSWQVSKDFPNLPAWIVKAVGGSTTHWAGASLRFGRARVQDQDHLWQRGPAPISRIGRSRWPRWNPGTPRPKTRWASTPHQRHSGTARQQQLQGAGGRRQEARLQDRAYRQTWRSTASRRDGRGSCLQIGFLLPGLQIRREMVDALYGNSQGRGPPAISRCAPAAWRSRSSTMRPAR